MTTTPPTNHRQSPNGLVHILVSTCTPHPGSVSLCWLRANALSKRFIARPKSPPYPNQVFRLPTQQTLQTGRVGQPVHRRAGRRIRGVPVDIAGDRYAYVPQQIRYDLDVHTVLQPCHCGAPCRSVCTIRPSMPAWAAPRCTPTGSRGGVTGLPARRVRR